jgi:predicted Zn-dependent protease
MSQDRPKRFLSQEECAALQERILKMGKGGGSTFLKIDSTWTGNLRWARNTVISGGDTQVTKVTIGRTVFGSGASSSTNALDDDTLRETVRRAEAATLFSSTSPDTYPDPPLTMHPHTEPKIWFDTTYNLGPTTAGKIAATLIAQAKDAGFYSAAYLEAGASARSVRDSDLLSRYYPYTTAQFSVTVRDPKGTGSGWAGVDWNDWDRINPERLSAIALDKCRRSLNPVAVEPGRYTTILEPQAVCDLWSPIMGRLMSRGYAEMGMGPFTHGRGTTKIGERIFDERITVSADPMDPDCGFPPFDWDGEPYGKTHWFENGVLKALSYPRAYAVSALGSDFALPDSTAFRMSGGSTSIEEMISTTRRGILVTRFNNVYVIDEKSVLLGGNTRDGLWLIENGKVTKAIKNFRFTESPLFVLNNIEQLGVPQRTFRPAAPAICPPIKCRDFSFTGLMDAV